MDSESSPVQTTLTPAQILEEMLREIASFAPVAHVLSFNEQATYLHCMRKLYVARLKQCKEPVLGWPTWLRNVLMGLQATPELIEQLIAAYAHSLVEKP